MIALSRRSIGQHDPLTQLYCLEECTDPSRPAVQWPEGGTEPSINTILKILKNICATLVERSADPSRPAVQRPEGGTGPSINTILKISKNICATLVEGSAGLGGAKRRMPPPPTPVTRARQCVQLLRQAFIQFQIGET